MLNEKKKVIENISKVERENKHQAHSQRPPNLTIVEEISVETHYNQILRNHRCRSLTAIEKARLS